MPNSLFDRRAKLLQHAVMSKHAILPTCRTSPFGLAAGLAARCAARAQLPPVVGMPAGRPGAEWERNGQDQAGWDKDALEAYSKSIRAAQVADPGQDPGF